ncbi:DinB family protein [Dyadobacter sp. LHD-138]|uniref:DinB family protein n=1 Tax=Dyadobacter sp. LHD-138 TaxID=3071413 RepID=UPI0027E16837|nr:DinB family protein [Dyadobacter sp. LHD-138]MDQ6481394.1 DinB family protein [Dyadobacter sp. LHD-138]
METVKSDRLYGILTLYDMQTTFFKNVIDGISNDDIHNRLDTKANHIAWLAGSAVHARFDLAGELGAPDKHTAFDFFRDNRGIQEGIIYPDLEVYKGDWEHITPVLRKLLVHVTDEALDKRIDMMPGQTISIYELLAFVMYREANLIGQIALWRRLLNYPAMKYM